jgi:hypothetical protein
MERAEAILEQNRQWRPRLRASLGHRREALQFVQELHHIHSRRHTTVDRRSHAMRLDGLFGCDQGQRPIGWKCWIAPPLLRFVSR